MSIKRILSQGLKFDCVENFWFHGIFRWLVKNRLIIKIKLEAMGNAILNMLKKKGKDEMTNIPNSFWELEANDIQGK